MNLAEETGGNTKDSCGEVISPELVCDVEGLLERSSGESFPKHQNPVLSCLPFHSGVLGGKLCDYFTRIFFLLKGTPE